MKTEKRKELAHILSKLVDAKANDEELAHLEILITNDPEAQAYYLQFLAIHCELEQQSEAPSITRMPQTPKTSTWSKWALAAAACITLGALTWGTYQTIPRIPDFPNLTLNTQTKPPAYHPKHILAVIGNSTDAAWNLHGVPPTSGTQLGAGLIHLTKGKIRLDFHAGEQVTLEAPATFEILESNLLSIQQGKLVAHVPETGIGFTVITPNGAVVDLGTEFAINIDSTGNNSLKVIDGAVVASSTNKNGSTTWEETLHKGQEVDIIKESPLLKSKSAQQYTTPLPTSIQPLKIGTQYTQAVLESKPLAYWKFDASSDQLCKSETDSAPLKLGLNAATTQDQIHKNGYLRLDRDHHQGYAKTTEEIHGLNTTDGCTIELWAYSDSMDWQSLCALTTPRPSENKSFPHLKHDPQLILAERAGLSGSNRSHIHPNLAMRAVSRSPAGYTGGTNTYSSDAYLIHRWTHIVLVRKAQQFQIFINGQLSNQSSIPSQSSNAACQLIFGRLHALDNDKDTRQWSGAIDEAAIYNRALTPQEIQTHFQAAQQ